MREISYPDGRIGFTFAKLQYVENMAAIVEAERKSRVTLVDAPVEVFGVPATVTTSRLDIGQPHEIFDGSIKTVARGMAANPFTLKVAFSAPVKLTTARGMFGMTNLDWSVTASLAGNEVASARGGSPHPLTEDVWLSLTLGTDPVELDALQFELRQRDALPDRAHIHLFEIELK